MTPAEGDKMPDGRKTSRDYWEANWTRASAASSREPRGSYYWRTFDSIFDRAFAGLDTKTLSLIELGAGGSEWLPRLAARFGFAVAGLDYSELGCARARALMQSVGIPAEIHCGDIFRPGENLVGAFDVVVSFGLVEHFDDTASTMASFAHYARPGGLVFTMAPNMRGLYGLLYRILDRRVFDLHVPLNADDLARGARQAGLTVVESGYVLGLPGVIDGARREGNAFRRALRTAAHRLTRLYWRLEAVGGGVPRNRYTSPYAYCVARKPLDAAP